MTMTTTMTMTAARTTEPRGALPRQAGRPGGPGPGRLVRGSWVLLLAAVWATGLGAQGLPHGHGPGGAPVPLPPVYPPDVVFAPAPPGRDSWANVGCCRIGIRLTAVSLVAGQRAFVSMVLDLVGPDGNPTTFPPLRADGTAEVEIFVDVSIHRDGREVGRQVVLCMGSGPADLMVVQGGLPPGLPPEGPYRVVAETWFADPATRGRSPLADDTPEDDRDEVTLVYPEGTLSRAGSEPGSAGP